MEYLDKKRCVPCEQSTVGGKVVLPDTLLRLSLAPDKRVQMNPGGRPRAPRQRFKVPPSFQSSSRSFSTPSLRRRTELSFSGARSPPGRVGRVHRRRILLRPAQFSKFDSFNNQGPLPAFPAATVWVQVYAEESLLEMWYVSHRVSSSSRPVILSPMYLLVDCSKWECLAGRTENNNKAPKENNIA
jgi:hypothetical protein